jgi:hypothetical protein
MKSLGQGYWVARLMDEMEREWQTTGERRNKDDAFYVEQRQRKKEQDTRRD